MKILIIINITGSTTWGFCPSSVVTEFRECPENYDKVEDFCIRVSPFALSWSDARKKCKSEGSDLVYIMNENVQMGINNLIKSKQKYKKFFQPKKWTTKSQNQYWIGGIVSIVLIFKFILIQ